MLQETKLDNIFAKQATSVLGRRLNSWDYIGAQGSRGGILVGWSSDCLQHCGTIKKEFDISIKLFDLVSKQKIFITSVYGPVIYVLKEEFLHELYDLKADVDGCWLIGGDFNLTRFADDRSSGFGNSLEMELFNEFISKMELIDIPIFGRKFTRTNERKEAKN